MNLCNFCTQLTFDLILRLGGIFRLGIHPSVFSYISRNTFSMDAKMYSKMPTEFFFFWLFGLATIQHFDILDFVRRLFKVLNEISRQKYQYIGRRVHPKKWLPPTRIGSLRVAMV